MNESNDITVCTEYKKYLFSLYENRYDKNDIKKVEYQSLLINDNKTNKKKNEIEKEIGNKNDN